MDRRALFGAIIVSLSVLVPATAAAESVDEFSFVYGASTDYPVMGDWNGDGVDTPGVVRGNSWYLSNTYNGSVDLSFTYGIAGDVALVGDWNGDGLDTGTSRTLSAGGRAGCLGAGPEGFFLNLDNDFRAGEPNNLGNVPVYYEFLSGKYVQYYFFYANDNAFPANIADHEGDWERVVIKLSPTNTPQRVAYYFHNCQFLDRDWNLMPKVDNNGNASATGTHLVVWAARGTHGSWPEVGDGQRDHCSPGGIGDDHLSNSGRRWRTWRKMVNVFQAPWYGFGGAWGERGLYSSTTGPLGPYPGKKLPPPGWGP